MDTMDYSQLTKMANLILSTKVLVESFRLQIFVDEKIPTKKLTLFLERDYFSPFDLFCILCNLETLKCLISYKICATMEMLI